MSDSTITDSKENKEQRILDAAAELFAAHPFHKVLLDDVARMARVGKGTLYLYFSSKDELYLAMLFREFAGLVERLRRQLDAEAPADEQMAGVVAEIVRHLFGKATIMELLRGAVVNCPQDGKWNDKRLEMRTLLENLIKRGIRQGLFQDTDPQLTAQYITGLVRSACLFKPEGADAESITSHATKFILNGLRKAA